MRSLSFVSPVTRAADPHVISRADLMPLAEYAKLRKEAYKFGIRLSKERRLYLGPYGTIDFLSYDALWLQVHEMLLTETRPGDEPSEQQIADELRAYNPLVPSGSNLPFTLFLEIENEERRVLELTALSGIERTITLDGIAAVEHDDGVHRTHEETGKTSAVHFMSFEGLSLSKLSVSSVVACSHPRYPHTVRFNETLLASIARDLH